ncbi:MAG: aryl-sulfate sulfotransferase [Bacteroidia bacterium]|nr:aryl-sulfate sulfotransferase [Bacteroidia bacterium]
MNFRYELKLLALLLSFFSGLTAYAQTFDGYALYNEQNSKTSYLIDKDGNIAHSWSCNVNGSYAVALSDEGDLVRSGVYSGNVLTGAAIGGVLQVLDKDANIIWEFVYSTANYVSHHDICLMPNGNVLLTAWEVKSEAELEQAGSSSPDEKWPTHIIEVQRDGSGGKIVWEWHIWDHLIQDHDATKDNYGVVEDHPELMDINAVAGSGGRMGGDWFHVNGIDYNETLDQIVFTSRYASEIFIIDHSTTTEEAASHSGGNSGKGGDFLYRWGNPSNYGSSDAQTIAGAVHDPRWIKEGRPNAGYIQFFNNVGGTGGASVVDAIKPPQDGYNYTWSGTSYGPVTHDWRHECVTNSSGQSASDRMSNGNTFVNVSRKYMYEVDSLNNIVWQYNDGPAKAFRYECNDPGPIALLGENGCGNLSANAHTLKNTIVVYPNPSTGIFKVKGLEENEVFTATVTNVYGATLYTGQNVQEIDLSAVSNGHYILHIDLQDGTRISEKLIRMN